MGKTASGYYLRPQVLLKDRREERVKISRRRRPSDDQTGQALVLLLFFMIFALTVTAAAVIIILTNSRAETRFALGNNAYFVAESGVENALLKILRNPSYSGETLVVDQGTANVTVTGSNPLTITSKGTLNNYLRQIQVTANFNNDILTILSWREI